MEKDSRYNSPKVYIHTPGVESGPFHYKKHVTDQSGVHPVVLWTSRGEHLLGLPSDINSSKGSTGNNI